MQWPELNPTRAFAGEFLIADFGDGEKVYKLNGKGIAVEWKESTNDR